VESRPRSEPREHPVTAWLAIAAILLASVAIFLAYLELNGTRDLEVVLAEAPSGGATAPLNASLQSWATGFSQ
jgi:hypothetical protein